MPIKAIADGAEKEITRIPVLGHNIETSTGTNSITFNTSSDRIIGCDILGNTQQVGTPAPDNIIMPDFCGKLVGSDWTIPITCAGQTTPVYLGEVPTVRRIKCVDLGTLTYTKTGSGNFIATLGNGKVVSNAQIAPAICSHFKVTSANSYASVPYSLCISINLQSAVAINKTGFEEMTGAEFKSAMSGVLLWYALNAEQTGIVNEPLAKIGDYADELHSEDAGVIIPTIKGTNTLIVDTTLPPSQTIVKYLGIDNVYKDTWEVRDNQDRLIWYREDTLTGTSSISYRGYGIPLKSMKIVGNGQQNGTPSPDNIIMPTFCGVRTANLLPLSDKTFTITAFKSNLTVTCSGGNLYFSGAAGEIISSYTEWKTNFAFELEAGTYYCNIPSQLGNGFGRYIRKYSGDTIILTPSDYTFTLSETTKCYLSFYIYNKNLDTQIEIMLNSGSTPLPYEPYGWAIPITNTGQTVPVYLGEVPTVRMIRKLVLTGDETWWTSGKYTGAVYAYHSQFPGIKPLTPIFCTHLVNAYKSSYVQCTCINDSNSVGLWVFDTTTSPTTFKEYLAQQYTNGTPVTIWYVLAEQTTAIVNEPLAKIGDYADELIIDPGITPQTGTNTLTVDTTLSPSSVSITGHIKQE